MPSSTNQRFKRHSSWTAEDSKAEMQKWISHKPPLDPAVEAIQKTLEANMEYFMENVACLCDKYNHALGEVLQKNPKAKEALSVPEPSTKPTPLLQRQASTVTAEEHKQATEDAAAKKKPTMPATIRLVKGNVSTKDSNEDKKKKESSDSPLLKEDGDGQKKIVIKKTGAAHGDDSKGEKAAAEDDEEEVSDTDSDASSAYDPSPDAPEVVFPDNTELLAQLAHLKREAYELGTTFDGIHDWIALNIPDMKEEDNEGVEVMGAVIEQVSSLISSVREVYGHESSYLEDRAELECTMLKYPDSASLRQQLDVVDANTWDDLDRNWRVLLRTTLILYTVMHKNMPKLKNPRKQRQPMAYAM